MRNKVNIKIRMEKKAFIASRLSDVCSDGKKLGKLLMNASTIDL